MQNKQFREYVKTREHECEVRAEGDAKRRVTWKNTNQLLKDDGCDGVKTGTTNAAGACLVATPIRAPITSSSSCSDRPAAMAAMRTPAS